MNVVSRGIHTRPWGVTLAACLFFVPFLATSTSDPSVTTPTPPDHPKKTVAVLYFDNYTGNTRYDPLGKGLASMMITDLAGVDAIQVVEREHLESLINELELQQSSLFDQETALQVGRFVGAEYVVNGSITAAQPEIRLDTRVIQVETSNIVKTANVEGNDDDLFDLQSRLADELIDGLAIALSPEEREALQARQEANRIDEVETALAYSEALNYYDQEDYVRALERMNYVRQHAPGSQLVALTYQMMRESAERKATEKAKEGVRSRLGRIIRGRSGQD